MKKIALALLVAATLPAATVLNIACGGSTDTGATGGARWTGAAISSQPVPYNAMRSSSPVGAPFSYSLVLAPGKYVVMLQFIEPRANQTAGQRLLNVAINGTPVITGLDLFAQVGALKPYAATFPVTITGGPLKIDFSASVGNALVSGIQIDSVDAPVIPETMLCEYSWGDGDAMFSHTYSSWGCLNAEITPKLITRVTCESDQPGQIFDLQGQDATGAWKPMLVAPGVCGPVRVEVPILPGASYVGKLLFVATIAVPTEQFPMSPTQFITDVWVRSPPTPVAVLRECKGSGPGWDCGGLLWATIPLSTGTLEMVGAPMPGYAPRAETTWVERKF